MSAANLRVVEKENMDKGKALESALSQIERTFGKGSVMKLGSRPIVEIESVSTGSLGLDVALGIGGLPKGRIIEIYGPENRNIAGPAGDVARTIQKYPVKTALCRFHWTTAMI